jgi:NDP-sugar pyrophosphorylase family protein
MRVLILAGGLGTRLASVLAGRPKALAPVGGKPFVAHQLTQLQAQGFTEVTLCVGRGAAEIRAALGDGESLGVRLSYSEERDGLLGTGGAIRLAAESLNEPLVVLNGDTYLDADLRGLVSFHEDLRERDSTAIATIAAVDVEDASDYGTLALNGDRKLVEFAEKGHAGPSWISAGVYLIEPPLLELVPRGRPVSLERDTFPLALRSGYSLCAYTVETFLVDIGTPEGYRRFCQRVEVAG